jgi:hypothetical protein
MTRFCEHGDKPFDSVTRNPRSNEQLTTVKDDNEQWTGRHCRIFLHGKLKTRNNQSLKCGNINQIWKPTLPDACVARFTAEPCANSSSLTT